jgi:hypothetical protein
MKPKNLTLRIYLVAAAMLASGIPGCKKILEEHPRSQITPQFFSTSGGILGGIAGVYSDMRNLWGTEGFTNMCVGGVDEDLVGGSGNPNFFTYKIVNGDIQPLWNIAYQDINTLNGVLEFGEKADIDDATKTQYLAQAKFLRAFYYFYLVQTYGDVPLHLDFITTASTADSRQPIKDVYAQIIKDLTEAAADLPAKPAAPFLGKAATQPVAFYLLAKAYLTRGWSSAAESDDFKTAYTIASQIIQDKDNYGLGLWPDFASVNIKANDYGQETLFVIDHSSDTKYGEYTTGQFAAGPKENKTNFFFRPNYPTMNGNYPATGGGSIMTRDINNGRPFIRVRPNGPYLLHQAFADRVNDSRYDNTFQTIWIANTPGASTPRGSLSVGVDTAIWMPDSATAAQAALRVPAFKGAIVPPGPTGSWTPAFYPSLKKYDDSTRASLNDASTRPFVMFRFSDVYLLAAEAYFKAGDNDNAAAMLNVLRQRAAYKATNTPQENADAVIAQTILPSDVTLDFILDEYTRENYGNCQRWWDLVRTQSLIRRVQMYNPEAAANIQPFHVLRPIPQTQIDLVTSGPAFPQNPGY